MLKSEALWAEDSPAGKKSLLSRLQRLEEQLWGVRRKINGHTTTSKLGKLAFEDAHLTSLVIGLRLQLDLDGTPVPRRPGPRPHFHRVTLVSPAAAFCAST